MKPKTLKILLILYGIFKVLAVPVIVYFSYDKYFWMGMTYSFSTFVEAIGSFCFASAIEIEQPEPQQDSFSIHNDFPKKSNEEEIPRYIYN